MGKSVAAALWLAVAVTLALQVGATQVGKGLGKDNLTVTEALTSDDYYTFFPNMDSPLAHAQGFYTYESFITAAGMFAKEGFGLKGGSDTQKREISAFLAHAAHDTTCGWSGSKGGPYVWGLCYNQELSPQSIYCTADKRYVCVNGVSYHGRGAYPIYGNINYGSIGNGMKLDLLSYPGQISNNATLAWASAIYQWVTPQDPNPSPHSVMVGEWKPKKADVDAFRAPGFGMTINILAGQTECGHGDDPIADDRISHYVRFISSILGVDEGPNLDCGLQGMLPTGFTAVL